MSEKVQSFFLHIIASASALPKDKDLEIASSNPSLESTGSEVEADAGEAMKNDSTIFGNAKGVGDEGLGPKLYVI